MTFSELIKNRRNELGLTLEEVAQAVGVKKSTILRWERGEIDNPRRDRIALLASILQLPPVSLVQEECGMPEDYPIKRAAIDQMKMIDKLNKLTPENRIRFDAFLDGLLAGQEKPEA